MTAVLVEGLIENDVAVASAGLTSLLLLVNADMLEPLRSKLVLYRVAVVVVRR